MKILRGKNKKTKKNKEQVLVSVTPDETLKVELVEGSDNFDPRTNEKHHVIMGGDSSNPTWEDYLGGWREKFRKYITKMKEYIKENNLIGKTGEWQDSLHFKFNDGTEIGFTWRAWGDLMQAIVGKREGYTAYYM